VVKWVRGVNHTILKKETKLLLPHLKQFSPFGSSHRSDASNAIKRACNYLIGSQNDDGGWKDMSAGQSVNDATGCAIVALAE